MSTGLTPLATAQAIMKTFKVLPTVPAAASRAIQLLNESEVDMGEVADILLSDQVMAARIIRIVNSPLYKLLQEIDSVRQAFVCGLLHDIGWIAMLEMLSKYDLDKKKRDLLMHEHHATLGALVAKKWNFSEEIQEVIKNHHHPDKSQNYKNLVQTIYLSDQLAKNEHPLPDDVISALSLHHESWSAPFTDHLDELDQEINSILSPQ